MLPKGGEDLGRRHCLMKSGYGVSLGDVNNKARARRFPL